MSSHALGKIPFFVLPVSSQICLCFPFWITFGHYTEPRGLSPAIGFRAEAPLPLPLKFRWSGVVCIKKRWHNMVHDLVLTNQADLPAGFLLLRADNATLAVSDFFGTLGMETKSAVTESRSSIRELPHTRFSRNIWEWARSPQQHDTPHVSPFPHNFMVKSQPPEVSFTEIVTNKTSFSLTIFVLPTSRRVQDYLIDALIPCKESPVTRCEYQNGSNDVSQAGD